MKLTDTAIKRLKPSDKCKNNRPDKHSDGNGLQIWVRPTGAKSFISAYQWQGKQREMTLGKYPLMSLAQARTENMRLRELVAQGIDPKEQKRHQKTKTLQTFDYFAQLWLDSQQQRVKPRTFIRDKQAYINHIKPVIGNANIYDLRMPDILAVHDRLAECGKTCTARKVIGWIRLIYDHAIIKGLAPDLICPIPHGIHKTLAKHTPKKFPRIKITELPQLLHDIDSADIMPITRYCFYVMAYTFVRSGELFAMRWQEIDFNNKIWRIPAERMKKGRPHIVPLAPQVIEILQTIKQLGLHREFVFFSNRSRNQPHLSTNSLTTPLKRMGYKGRMTGHGFRGLASTSLYEMQYNPKAIELQLAHVSGSSVERAYNDAEMLPMRASIMNDWANIIDEVKQGNFTTYRKRLTKEYNQDAHMSFMARMGDYSPADIHAEIALHMAERQEVIGLR